MTTSPNQYGMTGNSVENCRFSQQTMSINKVDAIYINANNSPSTTTTNKPSNNDSIANVYVANLPLTADARRIREFFESIGKVLHVKLLLDIATGLSRGIAFVMFENLQVALRACVMKNKSVFDSSVLHVRLAENNALHTSVNTHVRSNIVYIRNVPKDVTKEEVRKLCEDQYGPVVDITLHSQSAELNGPSPFNMEFVTFKNIDDACKAVEGIDGKRTFPIPPDHPLTMAKMIADIQGEMRKSILLRRRHVSPVKKLQNFLLPPPNKLPPQLPITVSTDNLVDLPSINKINIPSYVTSPTTFQSAHSQNQCQQYVVNHQLFTLSNSELSPNPMNQLNTSVSSLYQMQSQNYTGIQKFDSSVSDNYDSRLINVLVLNQSQPNEYKFGSNAYFPGSMCSNSNNRVFEKSMAVHSLASQSSLSLPPACIQTSHIFQPHLQSVQPVIISNYRGYQDSSSQVQMQQSSINQQMQQIGNITQLPQYSNIVTPQFNDQNI